MAVYEVNTPRIVWDRAEDRVVAVDCVAGYYYDFTPGASDLLEVVEAGMAVEDVATAAGIELSEVEDLIGKLLDDEVLRPATGGSREASSIGGKWGFSGGEISYEKLDDLKDVLEADPIHDVDPRKGWSLGSRG